MRRVALLRERLALPQTEMDGQRKGHLGWVFVENGKTEGEQMQLLLWNTVMNDILGWNGKKIAEH